MRVCELHRERSVKTLRDMTEGTEYDLCPQCVKMMESILHGEQDKAEMPPREPGKPGRKPKGA